MQSLRWMTTLLVLTWIVVDVLLISAIQSRELPWPEWPGTLGMGFALGQATLLAAWLVWGRSNIALRIGGSLAGMYLLASLMSAATIGASGIPTWFAGQMILVLVCLMPTFLAARIRGLTMWVGTKEDLEAASVERAFSRQYSIWGILSLMTAVSIALAAVQFVGIDFTDLISAYLFLLMMSANGTVTYFAVFLIRSVAATVLICLLTALAMGLLCPLTGLPPPDQLQLIMMTGSQVFAVFVSTFILRIGGLRASCVKPATGFAE